VQKNKIYLSSPHIGEASRTYVNEAFEQNWVAPLGPNVNGFEKAIVDYLEEKVEVAALSSGTAALHLALINLGVGVGDEVICQSFTFAASANPVMYQGATPVFVDSEDETWNICPDAMREAITNRIEAGVKPKAIILVHLYGMPCKMDALLAISEEFNIPIIEDSAEALGSSYKGKKCGTFGAHGVLSFNGNKIITTSGGGALVCNDVRSKERTIFLATQARDEAVHYQHSTVGYNYRLSNISAGIGRGQMEVLDARVSKRRAMNAFYREQFEHIEGVEVFTEPNDDYFSNHWLSAILVDPDKTGGITREDLRLAFEKDNIESRPLWKPMHMQPIFKDFMFFGTGVSEKLFEQGLCLPSGSNLEQVDRQRIEKIIKCTFV
jgi:dTDP-4-amino-4,6-dideoxygalactose transaminase